MLSESPSFCENRFKVNQIVCISQTFYKKYKLKHCATLILYFMPTILVGFICTWMKHILQMISPMTYSLNVGILRSNGTTKYVITVRPCPIPWWLCVVGFQQNLILSLAVVGSILFLVQGLVFPSFLVIMLPQPYLQTNRVYEINPRSVYYLIKGGKYGFCFQLFISELLMKSYTILCNYMYFPFS